MTLQKEKTKVIESPQKKNTNIGIIIFGIIFVYLVATIVMYISAPHVTVYEVRQGSILKDNAYTGFAIREEDVIYTDTAGYANYYVENNSKIRVGTKIYTISDKKLKFQENVSDAKVVLNETEMNALLLKIQTYNDQFVEDNFSETYQLKNEFKNTLDKYINQNKSKQLEDLLSSRVSSNIIVKSSEQDGIIVYSIDGMEDLTIDQVTSKLLKKDTYKRTDFSNNRKVKSGDAIYKIVTDNTWSLLIEVSAETKELLTDKTNVKVNFKKDNQELRANLSFLEDAKTPIACLTFDHSMIRYINDRYLDIELILENETGLKIPKSAKAQKDFYVVPKDYLTKGADSNKYGVLLKTKDKNGETVPQFLPVTVYYEKDGNIYLDPNIFEPKATLVKLNSLETMTLKKKETLQGAYCINKGYAVFKPIQILCESDEYYIIKEGNDYGLSNYDHISLNSNSIRENNAVF